MSGTASADGNTAAVPICHRDRTKTLLAAAMEHHLTGNGRPPDPVAHRPWDVWWACYRARRTSTALDIDPRGAPGHCDSCATDAARLAFATPPEHPDHDGQTQRRCSCFLEWARSMRQPAPDIAWPAWRLTVGMVKPGTDPTVIGELLAQTHTILDSVERTLTPTDVRRLYPDAYGADYITRQDDYLTSGPVTVFVLLATPAAPALLKDYYYVTAGAPISAPLPPEP